MRYQRAMGEGKMNIEIRQYTNADVTGANAIWNAVVAEGVAFPQEHLLDGDSGDEFFASQSFTGIAYDADTDEIAGLYILHPNNVGRCGHICNASYAVRHDLRGRGIGKILVTDCMKKAKEIGFGILQFNAVVSTNKAALELYKKLGFTQLGVIPKGFRTADGHYEDIIPHYIEL